MQAPRPRSCGCFQPVREWGISHMFYEINMEYGPTGEIYNNVVG